MDDGPFRLFWTISATQQKSCLFERKNKQGCHTAQATRWRVKTQSVPALDMLLVPHDREKKIEEKFGPAANY